jgi:hypothetical protein
MKWLNSLELKFGRYAIHGLIRIVVALNPLVFVIYLTNPDYLQWLNMDPDLVMKGQVWRLVSYIFIPALGHWWLMPDYLWLTFWLMFLWMMGEGLEHAWGAFKLNCYYLIGMIGTTIATFFFGYSFNTYILNLSLLFAFATLFPNYVIYIFLVLPIRIKWIAWFSLASLCLMFLQGGLSLRMSILAALANYVIFFAADIVQMMKHQQRVASRRQRFMLDTRPDDDAMHRCAVCNRTEISDPDLDFRVAADGHEYCMDHLPAKPPGA